MRLISLLPINKELTKIMYTLMLSGRITPSSTKGNCANTFLLLLLHNIKQASGSDALRGAPKVSEVLSQVGYEP